MFIRTVKETYPSQKYQQRKIHKNAISYHYGIWKYYVYHNNGEDYLEKKYQSCYTKQRN